MEVQVINTLGLKGPQPILKIALAAPDMKRGDVLEVWGDCPTFEENVRVWCERLGKMIVSIEEDGEDKQIIKIQL